MRNKAVIFFSAGVRKNDILFNFETISSMLLFDLFFTPAVNRSLPQRNYSDHE
jgi:hypothetical protein